MLKRIAWKLHQLRLSLIANALKPNHIISPLSHHQIKIHKSTLGDRTYDIVEASNAQLFTNNLNNITLMVNRGIEPLTSWQCHGWDNLPPEENNLLTGKLQINSRPKLIKGTVVSLLCGQVGHYNYFHWLFDVLARLQLTEKITANKKDLHFLVPQTTLAFQKESLEFIGLDQFNLISSTDCPFIQADHIITTTHPIHTSWYPPEWTVEFVRSRFLHAASTFDAGKLIYISRGDSSNSRVLVNESELLARLKPMGFQELKLSEHRLADQISIFSKAQMIVAVHGAGLSNLAFASHGTIVYELACKEYPNTTFEAISNQLNLEHHYTFCEIARQASMPMLHDLLISPDQINAICAHALDIAN